MDVLKIWVTPSGIAITSLMVFFVLSLCAFFSKRAQGILRDLFTRGLRGKWGGAEFQIGTSPRPPAPTSDMAGDAPPARPDPAALPSPAEDSVKLDHDNDPEFSLRVKMHIAGIQRDTRAFQDAYDALSKLPNRQTSDEDLTTLKLELEHEMGSHTALDNLISLAQANSEWCAPCIVIARIYSSTENHLVTQKWADEAARRSRNEGEFMAALMIRKDIVEKTSGTEGALELLRENLSKFDEASNRAAILEAISNLLSSSNDSTRSLLTLEASIRLDPLNKSRRFGLAYKYAQQEDTRMLAFYHYSILVDQDQRYPNALNNLAILANDLGMPAKRVALFKRAKRFEAPYPHGNLAIVLATVGFLDEAMQILEELPAEKRLETRAADAAAFIRRKRTEEEERSEKVGSVSQMLHRVYSKAADPAERPVELRSLLAEWKGSSGERLTLSNLADNNRLLGTLVAGSTEYGVVVASYDALLTGTAREKPESFWSKSEKKLVFARESMERLDGVILASDTDAKRVVFDRESGSA